MARWPPPRPEILIVGAGFGGIAAAIELRRHGFDDVTILERGARARRHVVLQHLPGRGVRRPEPPLLVLLRPAARLVAAVLAAGARSSHYLREVARDHGVDRPVVGRHARSPRARGTTPRARWTVDDRRRRARSRPTRSCSRPGQLHQPALPARCPARETLRRPQLPLGRSGTTTTTCAASAWRSIGTGASAVQFVPEIGRAGRAPDGLPAHGQLVPAAHATGPTRAASGRAVRRVPGVQALPAPVHVRVLRGADADDPPPADARARARRCARRCSCAGSCSDRRAAAQGLAGLHVRLQARAVQLALPAGAAAAERRARDRRRSRGIDAGGRRDRRRARARGRLRHLRHGLPHDRLHVPDGGHRRRRARRCATTWARRRRTPTSGSPSPASPRCS